MVRERARWGDAVEYAVELDSTTEPTPAHTESGSTQKDHDSIEQACALAYLPHVGQPEIGDRVLLSASAVARGLGTGGYMLIVAIPDRLPADSPDQAGHIVKARYTPSQFMVQGVDEQESPHHELLAHADSIEGMQVIAADLHSAVPAIAHAICEHAPHARVAYVMNDGGALPAWFSQTIVKMRAANLICGTITCGQAYGGDLEAVNVYTALLAAHHVWNADIAIVAQGPGNVGTGSAWGFSGVNVAESLNATRILDGSPIAALRLSNADKRERHFGISHHSMRVLLDAVSGLCVVPVPVFDGDDELSAALSPEFRLAYGAAEAELRTRAHLTLVPVHTSGITDMLRRCPVPLRTMGRDLDADAASFIGAAVAGVFAAGKVTSAVR